MDHSQYIVERLEESRDERGISVAELARRTDIPCKRLYYISKSVICAIRNISE